jgi:hypothetical protein
MNKLKTFESFSSNNIKEKMSHQELEDMKKVYDKYGFDIHSIPSSIQTSLNRLIKDYLKLKNKK